MDDPMNTSEKPGRESSPPYHPISPSPELVCGICQGEFWNPRGLRCFHTFCRDCLQQHAYISDRPARITCPTCLDVDVLPPDGIDGLKFNFYVDKLSKAKQLAAFNASCCKAEMKTGHSRDDCNSDTHCSEFESQKTSPTDIRDLETLVQSCRAKLQERDQVTKELNQQGIEMKHNMLNIKQQVHDLVQQIISDLQHRELKLVQDLESRYSKNISALSKAKASIDRTSDLLQEACHSAEKLIHGKSHRANMIHSSQMELSKLLVELSRPFSVKKFHFLPITQNITVKGLGTIVCSPITIFNSFELKTVHSHGSFFIDDRHNTTVKEPVSDSPVCLVGESSSGNSSKVLATRVDNQDVGSTHASGKEKKKTRDWKSRTSDETIPLKTSKETIPLKTAKETIPLKTAKETIPLKTTEKTITLKTSKETIPLKTSERTIPLKTSERTIPLKTSKETIPLKTTEKTITLKTSDKTIPIKTTDDNIPRDRSNHSVTKAISRESETIPTKARSTDHPVRDDLKIPRHMHVSKNTSSEAISQEKRNISLRKATPKEATPSKAAGIGHHLKEGTKIPRPVPVHNFNEDDRADVKSSFLARLIAASDVSLALSTSNKNSTTTKEKQPNCSENKNPVDKQNDLRLNYPKSVPHKYNSPSMPASRLTSANPGKTDVCKGNSVESNHQKAALQTGSKHRPSTPAKSSESADMDKTDDCELINSKSNHQKAAPQKGSDHSHPTPALRSAWAKKDKKDNCKKKSLLQKGRGMLQLNGELSKVTNRTFIVAKSRDKANAKVTFSKSDTAIPAENSGNRDSKKDRKPSAQHSRGKSLFKCLSKKDKKTEEKSEKARCSARILAECNRRHRTERISKIDEQQSPYETPFPTVRSSYIPITKSGLDLHTGDGKQQTSKTQKHQLEGLPREVYNTYMSASGRPVSGTKCWPWATRHQRSAKKRPDQTEKQS